MKTILDEMIAVANRCCGAYAGLSAPDLTIAELAREHGLRDDPTTYVEASEEVVRRVLIMILHHDPVYRSELLPFAGAERIAAEFVTAMSGLNPHYLTNGHFVEATLPPRPWNGGWPWWAFTSQTDSIFDAGVLAFTPRFSLCFWVAHDD